MRTLEQDRSKFAYNSILKVKNREKEIQKKYSSYVKNAPILIMSNGLAQTLAFHLSKMKMKLETDYKTVKTEIEKYENGQQNAFESRMEKVAYAYLFSQISEWLAEKRKLTNSKDPLKFVTDEVRVDDVMLLTNETIELLNWMRRFADAMLEKEED